jgi:hypothetical protein
MPKKTVTPGSWSEIAPFVFIALGSFLLGALLLFFMIWKAEELVALGLTGRVYYIVLLPLGLAAAAFLFGVVKSYATYRGRQLGGKLVLGGPIIAFLLVVILGFVLVPDPSTFPLTVFVHGPGGPQDIVLRNSGEVFVDLGGDRRHVQIGDQGQAYFPAIPANFHGQAIPAWVESETYESVNPQAKQRLNSTTLYLAVRKKIIHHLLTGIVTDVAGNPLSGVRLVLPEYHVEGQTNRDGRFALQVVAESQRMVDLVAERQAFQTMRLSPTLGDTGFNLALKRTP